MRLYVQRLLGFQTLIGTVKRWSFRIPLAPLWQVSNPHRYGQKRHHAGGHLRLLRVSNPHRYGQKLGENAMELDRPVSNPHRYGQKPHERWRGVYEGLRFKPS